MGKWGKVNKKGYVRHLYSAVNLFDCKNEIKCESWQRVIKEVINEGDNNLNFEKNSGEENATHGNKETSIIEIEEKEPEQI
ncbi:Hypothetical predicted protein [Olea europaea subsp. europaea]|uniref:Uncharacterized protein n=1 Tax=Olea europaea subsp. europaea TaxID=158383 RepID=A0A8S0TMC3_OLEEU|nr:Hypothetical predicted protein [Olea europaea subsp. europaea]